MNGVLFNIKQNITVKFYFAYSVELVHLPNKILQALSQKLKKPSK